MCIIFLIFLVQSALPWLVKQESMCCLILHHKVPLSTEQTFVKMGHRVVNGAVVSEVVNMLWLMCPKGTVCCGRSAVCSIKVVMSFVSEEADADTPMSQQCPGSSQLHADSLHIAFFLSPHLPLEERCQPPMNVEFHFSTDVIIPNIPFTDFLHHLS